MNGMARLSSLLALLFIFLKTAESASIPNPVKSAAADKISNLPNVNFKVNFDQYSGYVKSSPTHYLHYWLTESQNNPSTDPLVLWLSGGPGCSSVSGLLDELGPFHVHDYGATVVENRYTWSKIANVLYLESPAGVGYSFSTDGNTNTTDDQTAKENHAALLGFLAKFPKYKGRKLYITGESYAGVYLPTLGSLLVDDNTNFPNFKGMAIGNGLLNYPMLVNALMPYMYEHELVAETLWKNMTNQCCNGTAIGCNFFQSLAQRQGTCYNYVCDPVYRNLAEQNNHFHQQPQVAEVYNSPYVLGLDPYDLYYHCYLPNTVMSPNPYSVYHRRIGQALGIKMADEKYTPNGHESTPPPCEPYPQCVTKNPNLPQCAHYSDTRFWMQRQDVREALHIPPSLPPWESCDMNLFYEEQYGDLSPQVRKIMKSGARVLIYNGDTDTVCNAKGDQLFASKLGYPLLKDKQAWYYAHEQPNNAGMVTRYQGGLDFVSVRGSGHFVPTARPQEALQMLTNFIRNTGNYSLATGINVAPAPLVNPCAQKVLSNTAFGGPMPASSLCGHGTCVNQNGRAVCQCPPNYSGTFCNQRIGGGQTTMSLCAVYSTPATIAKHIRVGCPQMYTCVPYQKMCSTSSTCAYPVGYCVPWVQLQSSQPLLAANLRRMTLQQKL